MLPSLPPPCRVDYVERPLLGKHPASPGLPAVQTLSRPPASLCAGWKACLQTSPSEAGWRCHEGSWLRRPFALVVGLLWSPGAL